MVGGKLGPISLGFSLFLCDMGGTGRPCQVSMLGLAEPCTLLGVLGGKLPQ